MQNFKYILPLIFLLTGCSSGDVKETLGLRRSSPDEFNVVSNPPLYIPPEFNLPEPDNYSNELSSIILDTPDAHNLKSQKLGSTDLLFLKIINEHNSSDKIKKMIDDEYNEKKNLKKKKGLIRKAVAKLNSSDEEKYLDPLLEKERINNNIKENKPINEGKIPVKNESTLDKILK